MSNQSSDSQDLRLGEVLLSEEQISERVRELGEKISSDFDEPPLVVTVLRGSAIFAADLVRNISIDLEMDFLAVSSYENSTKSSGSVKIVKDIDTDINGRSVLIVEDIIDSGLTLNFLVNHLATRYPAEIKTCSLLLRNLNPDDEPPLDYYGFKIGDEFVVGYGLDYAQSYRNLPYIAALEEC